MKVHEEKEVRVVNRTVCVKLVCDRCGCEAEYPEDGLWLWGGVGRAQGSLRWYFSIDGECDPEELDLCYSCAEAVSEEIRRFRLTRKAST